jgi:hypothetical protein
MKPRTRQRIARLAVTHAIRTGTPVPPEVMRSVARQCQREKIAFRQPDMNPIACLVAALFWIAILAYLAVR